MRPRRADPHRRALVTAWTRVLCPSLVGRAGELSGIVERIAGTTEQRGGVIVLVGDAGIGKSRLLAAATAEAGTVPLTGRAVPIESPVPFRPLTEAFLAAFRSRSVPDDPTLVGFEAQLGRLAPMWRASAPVEDSPLLLGESVARLLAVLNTERPSVLVLEDLHWADVETLAVVEYLGDALPDTGGWCIVTTRPTDATADMVRRLEQRQAADVVRIGSLGAAGVSTMVAACLDANAVPAALVDFLEHNSDGNPLLVEELLAGLIAAGVLARVEENWEIVGLLTVDVPASLRESVARRVADLAPLHRRVVGASALLGRTFEWELLPGIAEVDGRTTVEALRAAVDAQLIDADGDNFSFRHALTREAVVASLLPPERRELARRAWPAIELANPGLPGVTCELAAELANAAGEPSAAAALLVESARRAMTNGALATAETTARRARHLAGDDDAIALDADEVLVHICAAAGKPLDALALGNDLAQRFAAAAVPPARRADLLVALARAAVAGADLDTAARVADEARTMAERDGSAALMAQIDATAAEVALELAELERAEQLALRAIEGAEAAGVPEVVCEALLVLGRVRRPTGLAEADRSFQRASDIAEATGLAHWHLRARQELVLRSWVTGDFDAVRSTRDLAARYGAHVTVAVLDLSLADVALSNFDRENCFTSATACLEASRRYGLATEPVANLWLAGSHALSGDDDALSSAAEAALARDRDDARILADLYGRVYATRAFVRGELDELPGLLDQMIVHVRRAPTTTSVYPGRAMWALIHTIADDDLGAAVRGEYDDTTAAMGLNLFDLFGDVMDAVRLGRSGSPEEATAVFDDAATRFRELTVGTGIIRCAMLLVAGAAIRDSWGDPVGWLRESRGVVRRAQLRPARPACAIDAR